MKKLLNVLGWIFIIYLFLFVITFMLYNGCLNEGNSVGVCKDNLATKVVTYPFNIIGSFFR